MPQALVVPTKAVLYARVSSKEQEKDGFSIPASRNFCANTPSTTDLHCPRVHRCRNGQTGGRSGFTDMLSFLKRNSTCRAILVEKTDRLYRNLKDWVAIDGLDVEVHFVKEGVVLSSDSRSSEKFVHEIKVLMAKN